MTCKKVGGGVLGGVHIPCEWWGWHKTTKRDRVDELHIRPSKTTPLFIYSGSSCL